MNKIEDYRLKNLSFKLLKIKNQNHQYFSSTEARLIDFREIVLDDLLPFEHALILKNFELKFLKSLTLETSFKCYVNKKCK